MLIFVAAYLLVWLGVFVFLARLDARQRQLRQTLDVLRDRLAPTLQENSGPVPRRTSRGDAETRGIDIEKAA